MSVYYDQIDKEMYESRLEDSPMPMTPKNVRVPPRKDVDIPVNIFFVRHAESCTNAIARNEPFYKQYKRLVFSDPPLTTRGQQEAKAASKYMPKKPDLVISSALLRALQTAEALYPNRKIKVLCGLEERVRGMSNRFSSKAKQRPFLNNPSNIEYEKWDIYNDQYHKYEAFGCKGAWSKNFKAFERDLKIELLNTLASRPEKTRFKKPLNIVVVGHSQWIRQYILLKKDKVKNLDVVQKKALFSLSLVKRSLSDYHKYDAEIAVSEGWIVFFDNNHIRWEDNIDKKTDKKQWHVMDHIYDISLNFLKSSQRIYLHQNTFPKNYKNCSKKNKPL